MNEDRAARGGRDKVILLLFARGEAGQTTYTGRTKTGYKRRSTLVFGVSFVSAKENGEEWPEERVDLARERCLPIPHSTP